MALGRMASFWEEWMERRVSSRSKRRIPCEIRAEGQRYHCIATEVSPDGFFVQTESSLATGTLVEVRLSE